MFLTSCLHFALAAAASTSSSASSSNIGTVRILPGSQQDLIPILKGFICPITHERIEDPVLTADGQTYERTAITEWLHPADESKYDSLFRSPKSPLTNELLPHARLVKNYALSSAIEEFLVLRRKHDKYVRELKNENAKLRTTVAELVKEKLDKDDTASYYSATEDEVSPDVGDPIYKDSRLKSQGQIVTSNNSIVTQESAADYNYCVGSFEGKNLFLLPWDLNHWRHFPTYGLTRAQPGPIHLPIDSVNQFGTTIAKIVMKHNLDGHEAFYTLKVIPRSAGAGTGINLGIYDNRSSTNDINIKPIYQWGLNPRVASSIKTHASHITGNRVYTKELKTANSPEARSSVFTSSRNFVSFPETSSLEIGQRVFLKHNGNEYVISEKRLVQQYFNSTTNSLQIHGSRSLLWSPPRLNVFHYKVTTRDEIRHNEYDTFGLLDELDFLIEDFMIYDPCQ